MGQSHHGGPNGGPQRVERGIRPIVQDFGVGKALQIPESLPRIDQDDGKARHPRQRYEGLGDMHGSDQNEEGGGIAAFSAGRVKGHWSIGIADGEDKEVE